MKPALHRSCGWKKGLEERERERERECVCVYYKLNSYKATHLLFSQQYWGFKL